MQDLPNGWGARTPSPKGASRVGLCGRGGGANSGGGGADPSIGPPPGRWRPSYATGDLHNHGETTSTQGL